MIDLDRPYNEQTRWTHWFRTHGLDWQASKGGITVNTYTNLVQAVPDGQGLALIGSPLIERFLASGARSSSRSWHRPCCVTHSTL
ncbi:hypothetical protein NKJ02_24075 [Mesorhizobium sp. M0213]